MLKYAALFEFEFEQFDPITSEFNLAMIDASIDDHRCFLALALRYQFHLLRHPIRQPTRQIRHPLK
jgi:hypothetical protein